MPATRPNLLTQAAYARHREALGLPGSSREAVRKAVDEGRISTIDGKIDPVVADIQWAQNTRARFSPEAVKTTAVDIAPGQDLVDQASTSTPPAQAAAASPVPSPAPESGYSAARTRREVAEAEQAEIELRRVRGDLVEREGVDRAGFEIGRDLRDTMDSAVNSLAAELAACGNADKCAEVLRRHNRAVCDVLVKAWREKMGAPLRLEVA